MRLQLEMALTAVRAGKVPQRAAAALHRARQHLANGCVQAANPLKPMVDDFTVGRIPARNSTSDA